MSPAQICHLDLEEHDKLNHVLRLLFPCTVHAQDIDPLDGHLHRLRLLTLSNGVRLMLKCSPNPTIALLRGERSRLDTEARALAVLGKGENPCIPKLFHYDPQGNLLGSSFLARPYVTGSTLQSMDTQLTTENRKDIERHLGFLANVIGQHIAPGFGTLEQVASGFGKQSWRETFVDLFEGVLRDAEDMYIHLPYGEIRYEVSRLAPALEDITLPRLVVIGLGQPSHVLLDPESKRVTGVVDFSSALWGDILMGEIFEHPSPAILDGFGRTLVENESQKARLLLYVTHLLPRTTTDLLSRYTCYHSVHKIAVQYYRSRDEVEEISARRKLTNNIANMVSFQAE